MFDLTIIQIHTQLQSHPYTIIPALSPPPMSCLCHQTPFQIYYAVHFLNNWMPCQSVLQSNDLTHELLHF
jgi:hypothetical protein